MARKAALITLGSQLGIQVIGLATGILAARFLGPEGRGELATIIAWVSMIAYLGNLGLPTAYTYAAAREPHRARQLIGNGILAVLIQWPLLVFVGLLILNLAMSDHSREIRELAVLYLVLYVPLNLLTLYANAVQQGLAHYRRFNVVRLSVPVSYLLGLGVLLAANNITIDTVIAANLLSNLAALALALALLWPVVRCRERDHALFDFRLLQRDLRYGLSAHLGAIQPFSSLRIDVLLLTLLLTSHEVGLYVAASAGAALIRTQGTALGMVLMPEVAKRVDRKGRYSVIGRFGALGLLLGGLTAAVAVIWAEPLIVLVYGEAFAEGATALRFLVMGAVLASLHRMFADALRGMGKPLAGTAAEVTSLVIGVPAILVLTRLAGLNGGAAAAALASLGGFAIGLWALLRALHGSRQPVETSTLTRAG